MVSHKEHGIGRWQKQKTPTEQKRLLNSTAHLINTAITRAQLRETADKLLQLSGSSEVPTHNIPSVLWMKYSQEKHTETSIAAFNLILR